MRLLMAVSADGFLCKGPTDDMTWTGRTDKLLFRILTGVGRICAAGSTTRDLMRSLPGRTLLELSRDGYTLKDFATEYPDGWLLGGPTVAAAALEAGLVSEVYISWILGTKLWSGVRATPVFMPHLADKFLSVTLDNILLECYETKRG